MKHALRLVLLLLPLLPVSAAERPNIVVIMADDLGYGDVSSYGATRIRTPHLDRLAREGRRFTDAHATSATCTPSRYALLTGRYPWRRDDARILPGDAPLLIAPGSETLPARLQAAGYATGVVGKWHLGLGSGDIDWNQDIKPGPLEIGFGSAFLIPATVDRVPCVYVENHRVVGLDPEDPIKVSYKAKVGSDPTGRERPDLLKYPPSHGHDQTIVNGISRIGYMSGGQKARWVDEDLADVITRKAVRFIEEHRSGPFFLYFATHDIHVPRLPHARFVGKSGLGLRGDATLQFDWSVGEVLAALDRLGIAEQTLVIVTSDNGPVVDDGYRDGAVENLNGHTPAGPLRGGKYSAFEAGTRVPFLVRWPGHVRPGVSPALFSQIDLLPTLAALAGRPMAAGSLPDAVDASRALLGEDERGRDNVIEHAVNGRLSITRGGWKYIEPGPGPARLAGTGIESGYSQQPQLYRLEDDLGETRNVAAANPAKVEELRNLLARIKATGR